jgi:hypothetical protein
MNVFIPLKIFENSGHQKENFTRPSGDTQNCNPLAQTRAINDAGQSHVPENRGT